MVADVGRALAVERVEGIAELVAGERQDRLVDRDHRDLGAVDRPPGGVLDGHAQGGLGAGRELGRGRIDRHRQRAVLGRHRQVDRADAVGRALGQRGIGLAVIADPGALPDQLDLDPQVGGVAVGDRHLHGVARAGHREPRGRHDPRAPHAQDALGGVERRLDQELGGVAGTVGLGVGDERDLLLFDVAGRRGLAARDPHRQLGAVLAAAIVGHHRGDAVLAALGRRQLARHRIGR
jgi:hypothetical protein